jgi:predicted PurR-regulated permease PerM
VVPNLNGKDVERQFSSLTLPLWIIAITAVMAVAYTASQVVAPTALGLVIAIVVAPLADKFERMGIPRIAVAVGIVIFGLLMIVGAIVALGPAFTGLMRSLPRLQAELRGYLYEVEKVTEQMGADDAEAADAMPSVADAVWFAPNVGAMMLITLGVLFFFTLRRTEVYASFRAYRDRLYHAERVVAKYFATVAFINLGLGVCTMGVMASLGLGNAPLWGAAAGALNFFLYLGPIAMVAALLVAGILEFQGFYSFLPALLYFLLNATEAQFVTPTLLGQRMEMNPLLVFLAVVFGLWIWGPIGAIVSLPIFFWTTVMMKASVNAATHMPETTGNAGQSEA